MLRWASFCPSNCYIYKSSDLISASRPSKRGFIEHTNDSKRLMVIHQHWSEPGLHTTYTVTPETHRSSIGITFPPLSVALLMSKACKIETAAMKTLFSAKYRPGQILLSMSPNNDRGCL